MSKTMSLRRPTWWRVLTTLAVVGITAATVGIATSSASGTTAKALGAHPTTSSVSSKPTIVLVHGAFADNSGWDGDIALLQKLKYPVIAVSPQMNGLLTDAAYVRSVINTIPGPVILVGHSYGGAVITNAAVGAANVKALVYVGAFVPAAGESLATILPPATYPGSLLGPTTTEVRPFPNAEVAGGVDVDISIKPADFRKVFAGDQSAKTARLMAATQQPLSANAETQASGTPAWLTIPSWDLITLDDHAISPAGQLFMAHRAHAHIRKIHSAHDVMVSHPRAVVSMILAAVRATT
jgi:pimeloyl-ACP methyl ester carboxylesterase